MSLAVRSSPVRPQPFETYWCDLDAGDATLDRALLSDAERARADRFRFDRDHDRFICGRAFLRRRLAAALDQPAQGLELIEGPWGKPALACGSVAFNLSHSGPLAGLAISWAGLVGIDLEFIDRDIDIAPLSASCFTAAECAVLDQLDDTARRERFFAFWTAKEAVMKFSGQGMSLPPRDIDLSLSAGWPIGYLSPRAYSNVRLIFVDPDVPNALCCIAFQEPFYANTGDRQARN